MRLIDADALENESIPFETHGGGRFIALGSIRNAPTIDPASLRPKGKWKPHFINNCGIKKQSGYDATCCGRWSDVKTPSCPNCGADMRGDNK